MTDTHLKNLKEIVKGQFLENELMSKHTSYGVGGPVKAFIIPKDRLDLINILKFSNNHTIETYFIGSGSNILFSDNEIDGIVISPIKSLKNLSISNNTVIAESGVMLGKMVKESIVALTQQDAKKARTVLELDDELDIMHAATYKTLIKVMLDKSVAYSLERKQFGRLIGSFQAVKHMCAEMAAQLEPCRSMVWFAGHALAELPKEARVTACHTKAHLAEVAQFVAKTATEVHGGMGFTDLVGLHYWFKRCGANRQWLGAPEFVRQEASVLQGLTD